MSDLDQLNKKFEEGIMSAIELCIWWTPYVTSPCKESADLQSQAMSQYKALLDRIEELETALKCASAANWTERDGSWSKNSPLQEKIEELVGNPPYGENE